MERHLPPTEKRLRDARQRGEVVRSGDVSSAAVFAGLLAALALLGPWFWQASQGLWQHGLTLIGPRAVSSIPTFAGLVDHALQLLMTVTFAAALLALLLGVVSASFQVGGLLAFEAIKPDLARLNPVQGLKNLCSMHNLTQLLKVLVQTVLLLALMAMVIRSALDTAVRAGHGTPAAVFEVGSRLLMLVGAWAVVVYAVMAAVDYLLQRHEFMKRQRMSIQDLRDEQREAEGDPVYHGRRRELHFESLYFGLSDRLRACTVLLHSAQVAVGLQSQGPQAPSRVLARGEGETAAQMRRIARDALRPVLFDADLAHRIYDEVAIDRDLPPHLAMQAAPVLDWATGNTSLPTSQTEGADHAAAD
jgi:type III secretion protein U